MTKQANVFTTPKAPNLDHAAMVRAWAELPRVDEVGEYMLAVASVYGHEQANALAEAIKSIDTRAVGARVFTSLEDAPKFYPQLPGTRKYLDIEWAEEAAARPAVEDESIGGLVWPLKEGGWQFVFLMADGTIASETPDAPATKPEPELSAARYTKDEDLLYLSKEFVRVGVGIAKHLRATAENVERHARMIRPDLSDMRLDHNYAASEILQDINSMHGNLNTSGLLRAAAQADRHAREGAE